MISDLFDNPKDQLQRELDERRKRLLAAGKVGSPGKISTMLGYAANNNMSSTMNGIS